MEKEIYIQQYQSGLTIRQIAELNNVSYETVRSYLKNKVDWKRKYISDFSKEEIDECLSMFDSGKSVKEIANWFEISPAAISKLLKINNRIAESSNKKYDILRASPINFKQKQFIVGTLLGDGCLHKDSPNGMYSLSFSHKKDHAQYFHWKIAMLDPFINNWRENIDKRKNSVVLQTKTICHQDLKFFGDEFYTKDRIKIVPKNLDMYFTPLTLAVWIMDDGNLNAGVNMRIASMGFSEEDHYRLQNYLRSCFNLNSKITGYKFKNKEYHQLSLNKENTQKLSDIIRPYVVDCMRYKIMSESSTTTCQTPQQEIVKGEDIV